MSPYLRPAELTVGAVLLLSVASVPVLKRPAPTPHTNVVSSNRIDTLREEVRAQSAGLAELTRQTQELSELLRNYCPNPHGSVIPHNRRIATPARDGGISGAPHGTPE